MTQIGGHYEKIDPKAFSKMGKKLILKALTQNFQYGNGKQNQAIFDAKEGFACFSETDLTMVMEKVMLGLSLALGESQVAEKPEKKPVPLPRIRAKVFWDNGGDGTYDIFYIAPRRVRVGGNGYEISIDGESFALNNGKGRTGKISAADYYRLVKKVTAT